MKKIETLADNYRFTHTVVPENTFMSAVSPAAKSKLDKADSETDKTIVTIKEIDTSTELREGVLTHAAHNLTSVGSDLSADAGAAAVLGVGPDMLTDTRLEIDERNAGAEAIVGVVPDILTDTRLETDERNQDKDLEALSRGTRNFQVDDQGSR